MKRRILSLTLAIVMILTMIPAAFAGDKGIEDLMELLPGNETVNNAVLEILNGGILGNEEESLQEIMDVIDKEYNKPHGTAGYVTGENSYFVSLGDSTITGMGTGDSAYTNYGYKAKVPASAPYQVAQALGVEYEQLAMAGLRATDLRYILDASFTADDYTSSSTKKLIDSYGGGIEKMRNDYVTELAKADLIAVSIGSCHFTSFINAQLSGSIAELLNKELASLLKGFLGSTIKKTISQYVDLDNDRVYEMNWEAYLGAEGTAQLAAALAETKAKLIEEGIPESTPVNLVEVAGLEVQASIKDRLIINVPVAQLMTDFMEYFLYAYVTFMKDSEVVFNKIHEIAPNAELLVLSMYNPTDELVLAMDETEIPLGEYYGYMVKAMSLYFIDYAEATPNTSFVDVYNTESNADKKMSDGTAYEMMDYLMSYAETSADFHATVAGNTYMKDQILAALAPEAEGLLGDADGSGVVDYVDAMLVLQYHTGVITNEALALAQCDVDASGAVDYVDAMLILQYHTGVISGF